MNKKTRGSGFPILLVFVLVGALVIYFGPSLVGYLTRVDFQSVPSIEFYPRQVFGNSINVIAPEFTADLNLDSAATLSFVSSGISCPSGSTQSGSNCALLGRLFNTWIITNHGFRRFTVPGENVQAIGNKIEVKASNTGNAPTKYRVFVYSKCSVTSTTVSYNSFAWRYSGLCTVGAGQTNKLCANNMPVSACSAWVVDKILIGKQVSSTQPAVKVHFTRVVQPSSPAVQAPVQAPGATGTTTASH